MWQAARWFSRVPLRGRCLRFRGSFVNAGPQLYRAGGMCHNNRSVRYSTYEQVTMEDSYVETKVEALEGNRAKVTITLDAKDVDARIKNTYKEFANKYNFPGFRKGKAPRPIIDNALGKDAVRASVADEVVNGLSPSPSTKRACSRSASPSSLKSPVWSRTARSTPTPSPSSASPRSSWTATSPSRSSCPPKRPPMRRSRTRSSTSASITSRSRMPRPTPRSRSTPS